MPRPPVCRLATLAVFVATAALVAASCSSGSSDAVDPAPESSAAPATTTTPTGTETRTLAPYEGVGTWVDVFDYAPAYQAPGATPEVTAEAMADMAALGIETVYLQAARDDERSPEMLADDELTPAMLVAAHEAGLRVVAWYLPKLTDVDADLERVAALAEFEIDGHRFDGLALDIEDTQAVTDHGERGRRLVDLSARLDDAVGDDPVGAIVLPPVVLEVVNDQFWPQFPWGAIEPHYDVWLPMSYWTNRTEESGYRDGYVYTDENIRRMFANLGVETVPLHPIGGIGNESNGADYREFVRASTEHGSIGWSIYDFATTTSTAWPHLRAE